MQVKDLLGVVKCTVCIYERVTFPEEYYEELYNGVLTSTPQDILDMEIYLVSASKLGKLEIGVVS